VRNEKSNRKKIAVWKFDLNLRQFQKSLSLKLTPQSNSKFLGEVTLSFLITEKSHFHCIDFTNIQNQAVSETRKLSILSSKKNRRNTFPDPTPSSVRLQNEPNLFLEYQMKSTFDSSQENSSGKIYANNLKKFNCNLFPNINQLKNKIIQICDELINGDLDQIKSFPLISRKILCEIYSIKQSSGLIIFASQWSETLLNLEYKDKWRKIYALIATIHLISGLEKKQLLSNDDLNIIICSFFTLYNQVFNSILENSKDHFVNDYQMKIFCQNLLDDFNRIGSGEYCNLIYSSLLMNFVLSFPDEFSDNLCKNLCVIKSARNNMKKVNINGVQVLLRKTTFDWLVEKEILNS
jgi:hypothetical protein